MSKAIFLAGCFILFALHAQCQLLETSGPDGTLIQYQKAEWKIELQSAWTNPYDALEITLDMQITSPSGKKLDLPCYYESGKPGEKSHWKARFTPCESGAFSYRFQLKEKGKEVSANAIAKFKVMASKGKGFLHPNNWWTLRYDNGELFRGIGENICWESRDLDDSKYFKNLHEDKRFNYDYMLKKLVANGGNFFRTWMIYWNLPVDWKTVSNNNRYQNTSSPYNESGMKRLDYLVQLCDSLDIHMMLALESHVGFMGDGWAMSSYNAINGGPAKTPVEFFTLSAAKQQYKNKLRLMVARYGYSPSIGAWEFFNEIDNAMYYGKPEDRISDSVISSWHNEMSTYLKSIDPYQHLVTTSISHRDVQGMNDLESIDLNQKHIYKNTLAIPATIRQYAQKHQKPYVIGESGYEWDWSKNFNDFAPEMDADFRQALWLGLFSPTPVLPMSWWWEFFEGRGMMAEFKLVQSINKEMLAAGKGSFEELAIQSENKHQLQYAIKCGNKIFIYLYNNSDKTFDPTFKIADISTGNYLLTSVDLLNATRVTAEKPINITDNISIPVNALDAKTGRVIILDKKLPL